ncbi:hypothetical protein KI387_015455, partial [Taxus chinensis]
LYTMGRKSKWSNIINLQVQEFKDKETFSSLDMTWTEIRCHVGSIDRVALIPYNRICDFIRGEENHPDTLCKFVCKANRSSECRVLSKRPSTSKQYSVYWCSYGPKDKRGNPQPPIRKRSYARKRGCQCHFIVKEIGDKLGVAIITYNMHSHEDASGYLCHGKYDRTDDRTALDLQKHVIEATEMFKVQDELTEDQSTHDLPNNNILQIDMAKDASPLEMEVHNTFVPTVAGGVSGGPENDNTSYQLVVQEIFDKIKMVLDYPPQSLSKALQLRELVDKFWNDINEHCKIASNIFTDPNACGGSLKRKKHA